MTKAKGAYEGTPAYEAGYKAGQENFYKQVIKKMAISTGKKNESEMSYWEWNPDGMDWGLGMWQCHECGGKNHGLPHDKEIYPLNWANSKYCPECGRMMVAKEYYEGEM